MIRLLPLAFVVALAGAQGLPPVPYRNAPRSVPTSVGGLKACTVGDTRYLLDSAGRVRSLVYAHLIPDNTLRVRQSYDHAGRLTGASVQWSGFAGLLLDIRGSFDSRERLVKETGFRAKGFTDSLASYLRPLPKSRTCPAAGLR